MICVYLLSIFKRYHHETITPERIGLDPIVISSNSPCWLSSIDTVESSGRDNLALALKGGERKGRVKDRDRDRDRSKGGGGEAGSKFGGGGGGSGTGSKLGRVNHLLFENKAPRRHKIILPLTNQVHTSYSK